MLSDINSKNFPYVGECSAYIERHETFHYCVSRSVGAYIALGSGSSSNEHDEIFFELL